jgi:hypothetical protein
MTDKQKLIDILMDALPEGNPWEGHVRDLVDHLIANGVTMQDKGKPLESFLHPVDAYNGLKEKYLVFKADTGEKVENCFVLRPDKDSTAVVALRTYAESTDNDTLANDIYNWIGKDSNVPSKWTPVTEIPDLFTGVNAYCPKNKNIYTLYLNDRGEWRFFDKTAAGALVNEPVTHWMPLPEPPEEGAT